MSKIKVAVEIDLDDLFSEGIDDALYNESKPDFQELLRRDVIHQVSQEVRKQISEETIKLASEKVLEVAETFVDTELEGILLRRIRRGDVVSRFGGFTNFDEFIDQRLKSSNLSRVAENHIDKKANEFSKEFKARYDSVFAARVVQSLSEQKMLAPNVAEMLLGEPDGPKS